MAAQTAPRGAKSEPVSHTPNTVAETTVVGWQGVRCTLPAEWNVTGFSMERDTGYLRVDAPGSGTVTVQIRWSTAAKASAGSPTLYGLLAPHVRRMLKRPEPPVAKPDLKANLERILKETAKQAKKANESFDNVIRPEKTEGENNERTAINFSWSGAGRGQGKIWYCAECGRIVVAQVVGMAKDQSTIASVASQLFSSIQDHGVDGYDLWALYDLQLHIPSDFRLNEQKLLSGYLRLSFSRGAERIILDRWGLANVTLKRFSLADWFANNALVSLKTLHQDEVTSAAGHSVTHYDGGLSLIGLVGAFRAARGSLRRFPTRYEGGIWECVETNRLIGLQVLCQKGAQDLWKDVLDRCICHSTGGRSGKIE